MRGGVMGVCTHARTRTHTTKSPPPRPFLAPGTTTSHSIVKSLDFPPLLQFVCISEKKLLKVLELLGIFRTFAPMNESQYVITAVNRLSGYREEISRPMTKEEAEDRLQRELESRRRQRYQPHTKLRVERRLPVQLTLLFHEQG